ncbi:uncharacterized protein L3040_005387 [Drepanopeziza brunnea f. sp. 'multigermtubi']|nr:hypothetical protein L3040_005387 [Drepanopeziza brunnea f. sp. 'multigermtubi']
MRNSDTRFYSCILANTRLHMQSCFSDNAVPTGAINLAGNRKGQPQVHTSPETQALNISEASLTSFYSSKSSTNMLNEFQQRRRLKTPVFFVGQLERNSVLCALDQAQMLAEEYQAVLPLRLKTSFVELQPAKRPKKLRKIKSQLSLRELVKLHSQSSPSTPGSDAETLIGSPAWPQSSMNEQFSRDTTHSLPKIEEEEILLSPNRNPHSDEGLKICTELLTTELASSLLRYHPTENRDRACELHVLLMIEAYERVQQDVRKMLSDAGVTGKQFGHVKAAEGILDHWLHALYAVYDRSQVDEERRNQLDCEWPVRSSHCSTSSSPSER